VQLRRGRLWRRLHSCVALPAGMLLAGLCAVTAHAGMRLDRTRVIVTQTGGSAVVQASNPDQTPVLLQVWVEPGEDAVRRDATANVTSPRTATPFIVDPPVLRLDAAALHAWLQAGAGQDVSDHLYLVDPFGRWMMRWPPHLDASGAARAKRDIERLLRASASWDRPGRAAQPGASAMPVDSPAPNISSQKLLTEKPDP